MKMILAAALLIYFGGGEFAFSPDVCSCVMLSLSLRSSL